jgi:hypothetical protein
MDNSGRARTVRLNSSMSITGQGRTSDGKDSYVAWTGTDCSVVIHTVGTIRFTEDEREVASISRGGRFAIDHEAGRTEREYTVRPGNDGLAHRYLVDGEPHPMDAAFETWRADLVLQYIRRTGYEAERRARRILASQGVPGLLREIELIPGDWAQGLYFKALLKNATIDPATAARLVAQAGRSLESDYELGQVLAAMSPALLENEQVRQGFVAAAATMESDYESRKVLQAVLQAGAPSAAVVTAMLELATDLDSDFELAELLVALAKSGSFTGDFDAAYLTAVRSIESDFEKHRVLSALLAAGSNSPATLRTGLEAARTIESDFEAAGWLKEVAATTALTDELRPAFFAVTSTIESDFERRGVLSAALARRGTGDGLTNDVLAAAAAIESDYELANVLVEVVIKRLLTQRTRPAFQRALNTIESSHERQRVLAAVGGLETYLDGKTIDGKTDGRNDGR